MHHHIFQIAVGSLRAPHNNRNYRRTIRTQSSKGHFRSGGCYPQHRSVLGPGAGKEIQDYRKTGEDERCGIVDESSLELRVSEA